MKKRADGRYLKVKTIDGKRVFFYSAEVTEKKALKDIENQMLKYKMDMQKGFLFSDVVEEWKNIHYENLEAQTIARYNSYTKHLIKEFGSVHIKKITLEDIDIFLKELAFYGYANKTIKDQTMVLKMIFSFAYVKKYIPSDIGLYVKPPKGKTETTREALKDDEIEIVNNSVNCTFGLFPYFLLYTGMRKGEALALRYSDIDFTNNVITVNKSVYYTGNTPHIKPPKTESGNRKIVLLDCLKKKLPRKNSNELIFTFDGEIIKNSMFTRKWNKYLKESGLENITPHMLRHTFATFLFEADLDCKDTQIIMGHKDIHTTQNIYTHIREERTKETAEKLNNFFADRGK